MGISFAPNTLKHMQDSGMDLPEKLSAESGKKKTPKQEFQEELELIKSLKGTTVTDELEARLENNHRKMAELYGKSWE